MLVLRTMVLTFHGLRIWGSSIIVIDVLEPQAFGLLRVLLRVLASLFCVSSDRFRRAHNYVARVPM